VTAARLLAAATGALAAVCCTAAPAYSATPAPAPGPLTVSTRSAPGAKVLVPGEPTPWLVDVAVDAAELDTLLGRLSVTGPLAGSESVSAEILTCRAPWAGEVCAQGEHSVLPPTPLPALTAASVPLQAAARPSTGVTHVQVRVRLAADADIDTASRTLTATLRVDAAGPSREHQRVDELPDTGLRLGGTALLALAAVSGGVLAALLAGRRRDRSRAR
jgi:hypothetical protein